MKLPNHLHRQWSRLWLRASEIVPIHAPLQALYWAEDPWCLHSSREQARYAATNALIKTLVPGCRRILELGCGEGFQTAHLLKLCPDVVGLDISGRAIHRARARCPSAKFEVCSVEQAETRFRGEFFDLIAAFEVLYYLPKLRSTLARLQSLGAPILVTIFRGRALQMQSYFAAPGWTRLEGIEAEGMSWDCFFWASKRD